MEQQFAHCKNPGNQNIALHENFGTTYLLYYFGLLCISFTFQWIFGQNWCDGWHSFDVLASTASILNLCVISLDRYWAITDPMTYPAKMTCKKATLLIIIVWICSATISFPAIAWWRATDNSPNLPFTCQFTEDTSYLIFR